MFPNFMSALDPQQLQSLMQGTQAPVAPAPRTKSRDPYELGASKMRVDDLPPLPKSSGLGVEGQDFISFPASIAGADRGLAPAAARSMPTLTPPTVAPPESIFRMATPEATTAYRNAPDDRGFFGGPKSSAANFSPEGFMPGFVRMDPFAPAGAATDVYASNPMEYMLAMQRAGLSPSVMNQFVGSRVAENGQGLDANKANAELGLRAATVPLELQNRLDIAGLQGQAQRDVAATQAQGLQARDLAKAEQDIRGAIAIAGNPSAQHIDALTALNAQRMQAGLPPINIPKLPPPAPPPEPFWDSLRKPGSPFNLNNFPAGLERVGGWFGDFGDWFSGEQGGRYPQFK